MSSWSEASSGVSSRARSSAASASAGRPRPSSSMAAMARSVLARSRRLGLRLEAQLEDGHQLLVAACRAEHRLEDVGGVEPQLLARLADGAGGGDGVVVRRVVLEHEAVLLERVARALQLARVEVADGGAQLDARLLGLGGAGLELEVAEQLVPQLLGAVEPLQRGEHGGVARPRVERGRGR